MNGYNIPFVQAEKVLLKTEHAQRCIESNSYFIREGILQQEKLRRELLLANKKVSNNPSGKKRS